jgi:succinate-acetate transporter protein
MENIDWQTAIPVSLAIAIFLGGMLMMFTGIWTSRNK